MTTLLKFLALLALELIKHYGEKLKPTTVDSTKPGDRERRLRDKIKKRWDGR
jgi:hypothetical protein